MATQPTFFPLDTTGTSKINRREQEIYNLPAKGLSIRAVSISQGCFFTATVVIFDEATNYKLEPGVDYLFTEIYSSLSIIHGQEIAATIVITNANVSDRVSISYNFLGSHFNTTVPQLAARINHEAGTRYISPLQWGLVNQAKTFIPSNYAVDVGPGIGFETIVFALERIRSTFLYHDFEVDATVGNYINDFITNIGDILKQKIGTDYSVALENFGKTFNRLSLQLDKLVNMPPADPEIAKLAVIRDYPFRADLDGYITLKAINRFKEELYNNLVNAETSGIGKYYGVYGLPLIATLHSLSNGAGIITDSFETAKVSGYDYNFQVFPDRTSPSDKWSIVKVTNNPTGQGGVLWGTNMTTSEVYVGKLDDSANSANVLIWNKLYGEFDIEKAVESLNAHIHDYDNPHKTTVHQMDLGNVENLPLATVEDLACRAPSRKYVTDKFLRAFMATYMTGMKTADDLKNMDGQPNDVIRDIKLLFAPCGSCGPCCEPNVVVVPKPVTSGPPINYDPAGQLTGWYCDGNKRWDVFTDGFGGTITREHVYGADDPDREEDGCVYIATTSSQAPTSEPPVSDPPASEPPP